MLSHSRESLTPHAAPAGKPVSQEPLHERSSGADRAGRPLLGERCGSWLLPCATNSGVSIPDLALLDYTLTMACGHRRRTMSPQHVGRVLPCLEGCGDQPIAKITHDASGRELQELGWITPQAAAHGAYDEARARGDRRGQQAAAAAIAGSYGIRLPRRRLGLWSLLTGRS